MGAGRLRIRQGDSCSGHFFECEVRRDSVSALGALSVRLVGSVNVSGHRNCVAERMLGALRICGVYKIIG